MQATKSSGLALTYRVAAAWTQRILAMIGLASLVLLAYDATVPAAPLQVAQPQEERDPALLQVVERANPKYQALAQYLSRRYQVAADATEELVALAFGAGRQVGLDPLLILAVMAVESRFNPIAESVVGAKGLMQVIPRHHLDKLEPHGGPGAILDPATNVLVGATILKEYILRSGSLEAGLQWYNGAPHDASSQYAGKVLAVQERLRRALAKAAGNASPPSAV